ncbi:MAG: tetratricopeptide repeat protein [Nannocystales bacterium]
MEDPATSFLQARADGTLDAASCRRHVAAFDRAFARTGKAKDRFNAGVALEMCGTPKQAEAAYLDVVRVDPDFGLAYNNLGTLSYRAGDVDEAIRWYRRAHQREPRLVPSRLNLAHISRARYLDSGDVADFDRAQRSLQAVLALQSDNLTAYEGLARLYYERAVAGDRSYRLLADLVVTQAHRRANETGQESAELWNLQGLLALEGDEPTRALRAFEKAINLDPKHVDARLNAALLELELRNFASAEQNLEAVALLAAGGRKYEAAVALGVAKRGTRDFAAAEHAYAQAFELDDTDPRPLYNAGVLYQEHIAPASDGNGVQEGEVAAAYFERFAQAAKGDPRYADAVAASHHRLANLAEYASLVHDQLRLEADAAKLEAVQRAQEEARRSALLEMERKAQRALDEAAGGER